MTRLQNAKNQLIEALALLESAASQSTTLSYRSGPVASSAQMGGKAIAGVDLSALADEVSIIEAKLSQAMNMIASIESDAVRAGKINDGDTK